MLERAAQVGLQVTEQPLQYIGRARQLIKLQTTDSQQYFDPCSIVIVPTVLTDGRVSLCCTGAARENPRLIIGDLNQQSFPEIVRKMQVDLVQNALRVGGPGLLWKLASNDGSPPPVYQSKCQFCRAVCQIPGLDDRLQERANNDFLTKLISADILQRATAKLGA
jgi:hypothetical protein